jgi:uncharacterized protein
MRLHYLFIFLTFLTVVSGCKTTTNSSDRGTNSNHLINEKSPYLLQHAHNPVDWYPWGAEALEKAEREDKLIVVSIGYSSCHWCHVMEKESFADTSVSKIMNEHFISIKVDREERPDIDNVYMSACQIASDRGCGWPLNAITLPNGKPVFVGTYYPKNEWIRLLNYFIEAKETEPEKLINFAEQLTQGIQQRELGMIGTSQMDWDKDNLTVIAEKFTEEIDFKRGGKKGAPKFPLPNNFEYLLQTGQLTGKPNLQRATLVTLDNLARGGIFDHLAGGFARYSTDAHWKVPHFEKMLYDNAQLISLFSQAYKLTKNEEYRAVVEKTIQFLDIELRDRNGGYYSSIDADSEGEEGTFYVWTKEAFETALSDEDLIRVMSDYYDIRPHGNWEHEKNVLYRRLEVGELAKKYNKSEVEISGLIERSNKLLYENRAKRERPGTDDKILTAWNAMLIKGFTDSYMAFGNPEYLQRAKEIASFLESRMTRPNGALWRTYKSGEAGINAFLEDYAHVADAYISLYQVSFEESYLLKAEKTVEYALEYFEDEDGLLFFTSKEDPPLVTQKKEINDNVIPSSNSVMAKNLYYLGTFLYKPEWIEKSEGMLGKVWGQIMDAKYPGYYSNWLQLAAYMVYPLYEVAIVGDQADNLRADMQRDYHPNVVYLGGEEEGGLELLKEKKQEGETFIYVCLKKVCKLPVMEAESAAKLITY